MENLNLGDIPPAPTYKRFTGRYVDAMPALRAEGRIPMSISGLMKRRLQVLESRNKELIRDLWGNYFYSSTGIARQPYEIKIAESPECLLNINSKSKLLKGALVLTEKQYDFLDGEAFLVEELEEGWLPKDKVIKQLVWRAAADSKDLLQKYINVEFKKYNFEIAMGVYLPKAQDVPILLPLTLYGGDSGRSDLYGRDLSSNDARLEGIYGNLGKIVAEA